MQLGEIKLERRATTKNNENQSVCDRFSIVYLLYWNFLPRLGKLLNTRLNFELGDGDARFWSVTELLLTRLKKVEVPKNYVSLRKSKTGPISASLNERRSVGSTTPRIRQLARQCARSAT